jgi:hypothetical protein
MKEDFESKITVEEKIELKNIFTCFDTFAANNKKTSCSN